MTDKTAAKLPKMYGLRRDELHGGMGRGKRLPRSLMPRNGCDLVGAYLDAASAAVLPPSRLNGWHRCGVAKWQATSRTRLETSRRAGR